MKFLRVWCVTVILIGSTSVKCSQNEPSVGIFSVSEAGTVPCNCAYTLSVITAIRSLAEAMRANPLLAYNVEMLANLVISTKPSANERKLVGISELLSWEDILSCGAVHAVKQTIRTAVIFYAISQKILPWCDKKFNNWWYGKKENKGKV